MPEPPEDHAWNPTPDGDHLVTYVWVHLPDNSFILRERAPGHVVDADEVASVLEDMEHDHSVLNAVAGVEPLMELGSRQDVSHFPPLALGAKQRRHTFHGMAKGHVPSPVHVTPVRMTKSERKQVRRKSETHGYPYEGPSRQLFALNESAPAGGTVHKKAQPVGPAARRKYSTGDEAAYYPPTWAGSKE